MVIYFFNYSVLQFLRMTITLDIPSIIYNNIEPTVKGLNTLYLSQREKRKSMDSVRSKSNLNKDLDLVEISQEYEFNPNEPKPYQRHNEYPPQSIRKLIKNSKNNRNYIYAGNLSSTWTN